VAKDAASADLRRALLDAHDGLRYRDHFEILGVARAANEAEVKQAYVRLVRTFHPDACNDPSLADVGGKRNAVLARAREAYDTLRDPAARAAYERNVAPLKYRPSLPRNPAPPPAETAPAPPPAPAPDRKADAVAKAAALIRQARYWDAIQLLEPAIVGLQDGQRSRARVLLAQAYMKNPKWLRRAEGVLQDVVKEDPAQAEAYLLLGQLYRESGLEARAASALRKVLDLRPGHPQAAAELESLEAARRPGPPSVKA
jgi:predicted Zn-dependent protease